MAIVKMRKLNLIALSYDKDSLLDALHRTGAVEVTLHNELAETVVPAVETEDLKTYYASTEAALSALCVAVEEYEKENGVESGTLKDGFDVSYSEFISMREKKAEADALTERVNRLVDERNAYKVELVKIRRQKMQAEIYSQLTIPFSVFGDTAHTRGRLGVIPAQNRENVEKELAEVELSAYEILNTSADEALFYVSSHKLVFAETGDILSAHGFALCPYKGDDTGQSIYAELSSKENKILRDLQANEYAVYALKDKIRFFKTYCDHLAFTLEKEEISEKLRATGKTFLLQAYVPEPAEEAGKTAIGETTDSAYMEFTEPTSEETPPTLLKNNGIVSNFEGITNTYSAPNYREFDPNAIMAFFYSLFMGFIIGDAGYGFLMLVCGGWIWWKNRARPTGLSRLAGAFAVGGVFAIIWGLLFNSLFGFTVLGAENTLMPNPQTDMWSLMGINVPAVLLISMLIGIFQLFVGYLCKAIQEWRRGSFIDGVCDGLLWAIFSVGVALAIIGLIEETGLPSLGAIGGIIAGVSLALAVLTAGRKEKFFGKFTKGFGAAYGVINYASDILSYARLYGLMLSGAVIAQIIATYSGQFIVSGNIGLILLGAMLLIVGHAFNLVMNLLGAYIHDARLQYVEFYGRFFEGEGELFKPLGSGQKYVYVLPEKNETQQSAA